MLLDIDGPSYRQHLARLRASEAAPESSDEMPARYPKLLRRLMMVPGRLGFNRGLGDQFSVRVERRVHQD